MSDITGKFRCPSSRNHQQITTLFQSDYWDLARLFFPGIHLPIGRVIPSLEPGRLLKPRYLFRDSKTNELVQR